MLKHKVSEDTPIQTHTETALAVFGKEKKKKLVYSIDQLVK